MIRPSRKHVLKTIFTRMFEADYVCNHLRPAERPFGSSYTTSHSNVRLLHGHFIYAGLYHHLLRAEAEGKRRAAALFDAEDHALQTGERGRLCSEQPRGCAHRLQAP